MFCNSCSYHGFVGIMVTKYEIYLLGQFMFFITLIPLKNILTIFFWNPFTLYYICHYKNASNKAIDWFNLFFPFFI